MKKFFIWFGIVLVIVLVLVIVVAITGTVRANRLLTQKWEFEPDTIQIPTDVEAVSPRGVLYDLFHVVC